VRSNLRLSAVRRRAGPSRVARVQRTTTTAALLVTVAVSALSGCMTVQSPPASGPPAPPGASARSGARPDGSAAPQIVQAPAREALELVGPSRRADPTPGAARRPAAPRPPAADKPRAPRAPARAREGRGAGQGRVHQPPRVDLPRVTESMRGTVPGNTDVCALGRQLGGWRPDSPEARTCTQVYGH
jgi:hypothetical protein